MVEASRRGFLKGTAAVGAAALLESSIARALATPANRATGTIQDVEHVVVLMQENRSFDSYYAAMRGVRGFGDPHPAVLPSGKSVWNQSDGVREVLPFHPDVPNLGRQFVEDLDHNWKQTHEAFDDGRYDKWLQTKTSATMMYYRREDMPWYYQLADAFTICDAYHCSLLGPTDPNRYYMWTGWTGNDGVGGGPDLWNDETGYSWTTYPERLQQAGVSWKIYQDVGDGLDKAGSWGWVGDPYIGNFGDTSLLYFTQYQNAAPGSPLYDAARTGTQAKTGDDLFRILAADVKAGTLPQVSWVVAPEAYSEHGNWPVDYGIWYTAKVLDILTSNPDVWSRTALVLVYDENDGFFDHLVPPHPDTPQIPGHSTVSTAHEYYSGPKDVPGHYGLGIRVPAMVISPWSTGGWVCSETFDHTSIIRFLEQRFGVHEPQISDWRRAVCGDLTSAFDFRGVNTAVPRLPDTSALAPTDRLKHPDFVPVPPAVGSMPSQEKGTRPSRALGYRFDVNGRITPGGLELAMVNDGPLGVHVQARPVGTTDVPHSYTTGAGHSQTATMTASGSYDVHVHGPDGFFRRFAGSTGTAGLEVTSTMDHTTGELRIEVSNTTAEAVTVMVKDALVDEGAAAAGGGTGSLGGLAPTGSLGSGSADGSTAGTPGSVTVQPKGRMQVVVRTVHGWYDVSFTTPKVPGWTRTLAGRVHTGTPGISDPQLGR